VSGPSHFDWNDARIHHVYFRMSDGSVLHETPIERCARYWKRASNCYRQACSSEGAVKDEYMDVAMGWAALASECDRQLIAAAPDARRDHLHH